MRVLAWVPQPTNTSPGQRFRIEQWEPHLKPHAIEIVYSPFASPELCALLPRRGHVVSKTLGVLRAVAGRLRESRRVGEFDLLYVFREGALLGPALAERIAARRGVPVVFDFDDAVWVRYVSPSNSVLSYLRFPGKTATLCRLSRHVMAGNHYLEQYARRFNTGVSVVPTTIDTDKYRLRPRRSGSRPVIGWTGSFSTVQYLRIVKPAVERLRRRYDFRFVVIGGSGFGAEGVEVEQRPWRAESEVEDLSDLDIGIMPLPDAEWERGKCGLKLLQYMALGIPAVASPVGANTKIIEHERNGLLVTSESDWEAELARLLADTALASRLGAAGRATVEARYSAQTQAPRVASIFHAATG